MPRVGLNQQTVVREAARLADEVGYQQLTLAALASRLGVALPSLYKHVRGGRAGPEACRAGHRRAGHRADHRRRRPGRRRRAPAMADAYRGYAHRHPGRYPATQRVPDPADPEHVEAGDRAVGAIFAVLRGYGLTGDDAVDATRALRSSLHGFVTIEAAGGFGLPREVDRSYHRLVASMDIAFRSWPGSDG
ncbi:WHG domain-containing protein [Micromonospora sp. M12]